MAEQWERVSPLPQVLVNVEMVKYNQVDKPSAGVLHSYKAKNVDAGRVKNWGYCGIYHSLLKAIENYSLINRVMTVLGMLTISKYHFVDGKSIFTT